MTVRGLGPNRTTIDGVESPAVVLGADSRLEHCRTTGGGARIGRLPRISIELVGDGASMLGCDVIGHVAVRATGSRVTSCTAAGVVARDANRVEICRCTLTGMGQDTGIEMDGGAGHLIDSCEMNGHLAAIVLRDTVGASVRHCRITARWWGVRLIDTEATDVTANKLERTMRAVDIDGGTDARVTGNAAADGDSGCLVQRGASNAQVAGNYWERCRVGLMAWGAGDVRDRDNNCTDLGETEGAAVIGP